MASITIRNLDDDVKTRLRVRAAEHHRSMEEEARVLLREAVSDGKAVPGTWRHSPASASRLLAVSTSNFRRAAPCANLRTSPEPESRHMFVIDTNVASELMRSAPASRSQHGLQSGMRRSCF